MLWEHPTEGLRLKREAGSISLWNEFIFKVRMKGELELAGGRGVVKRFQPWLEFGSQRPYQRGPQPPLNCSQGLHVLFWLSLAHTCGILTHTYINKSKSLKTEATPEASLGYTVKLVSEQVGSRASAWP